MLNAIFAFITYFVIAIVLLASFVLIYIRFTPYREFKLIEAGNNAAAITLSGAVLGFTFPVLSSIFYTQSILEMMLWAAITCVVQLSVFLFISSHAKRIEGGSTSTAIMVATLSVAVGLINAVCISH